MFNLRKKTASPVIRTALLFLALLPLKAGALDVQLFEPVPWVSNGATVFGSDTLARHGFETGAYLNWARNPIEFGISGTNARLDDLVNDFIALDLQLAYGISNNVMFAADVPVYLFYKVEPPGTATATEGTTLGDLRLNTIWQVLRRGHGPLGGVGFALIPFLTIPVGNEDQFVGNENFTGGVRGVADWDLSKKSYLKFNLGFRLRETEQIANLEVTHEIFSSLGYAYRVWPKHDLNLFAELFGSTTTGKFMSEEISSPMEIYIGARKGWFGGNLRTVAGVGRGLNNGYGAPDFRVFAGATLAIGKKSTPSQPPPPPALGHLLLTIRDEDGTPHPGLVDFKSAEEGGAFAKSSTTDRWSERLSPGSYLFTADVEGYYKEAGRVRIAADRTTRVEIVFRKKLGNRIEAVGQVLFDINKASIKDESLPVLNGVVDILQKYPEVSKLQVGAHTDAQASEAYNLDLSARRAKSVLEYLTSKGISADRLVSKGWGEGKPLDTNKTKVGRAKNRRVEFVILEMVPESVVVKEYEPGELYNLESEKTSPEAGKNMVEELKD